MGNTLHFLKGIGQANQAAGAFCFFGLSQPVGEIA
jgi:hypothetical protein